MPLYRWTVPADSVTYEQRARIALACTDIHCGSTNAPRGFVHVVFNERDESKHDTPYYLDGMNRAGRPVEQRDQLLNEMLDSFREITGASADLVGGRITETPAKWTMEGGMVLPEPGEETEEWYSHGQAAAGG